MSVSIVIPALNEEDAIAATVRDAFQAMRDAGETEFEVIVVDDGSRDRTGELAREAGAVVVRHVHNVGYGRSLKDGVRAAKYPIIAITDADGTYPIRDIPRMLAMYREGYDMIVGARTGAEYRESIIKAPLRAMLRTLVEFTSSRDIPDINSGLRLFNRDQALRFEGRLCDTFSYTTSLTLAFMMNGLFVGYTPIAYYKRIGQGKVRLFKDSIRTLQYISEAAVFYNPLRIFTAMAVGLVGLGVALVVLNVFIDSNGVFLIAVGAVLSAIIVFALGLLAVVLKKILDEHEQVRIARR